MKNLNDKIKAQDASEISLDDIRQQCGSLASNDSRFNVRADGTTNNCYCYATSLLVNGESFKAVINAANNKYYEVPITIADGVVTSLDDGEVEVKQKTMWVTARAAKGICFNGEVVKAGGPGGGRRAGDSQMEKATQKSITAVKSSSNANESGKKSDHLKAALDHQNAADAHKDAAKSGPEEMKGFHGRQSEFHTQQVINEKKLGGASMTKASSHSILYASGTPDGAASGHATKKSDAAESASTEAYEMSKRAHESGEDKDHGDAKVAHETAIEKHKAAALAQGKNNNPDMVNYHIDMVAAHTAVANAHDCGDADMVEASMKSLDNIIKAEDAKKDQYTEAAHDARDKSRAASQATEVANESNTPDDNQDAEDKHGEAKEAHKKAERIARSKGDDQAAKFHGMKAGQHATAMIDHAQFSHASDKSTGDIIRCKDNGTKIDNDWKFDEPVTFMYMPAGVSTITAGFRDNEVVTMTVEVDEDTAATLQACYGRLRTKLPKLEPYGCIEHNEADASIRAGLDETFTYGEYGGVEGVLITGTPTTLGADHVNGKIHRCWSPSFATDANYSKAKEKDGHFTFPDGVRGSASNPARITGCDFCLGTLVNKPAFQNMPMVKARQGGAKHTDLDVVFARLNKPTELETILQKVNDRQPVKKEKTLDEILARLGQTG